MVGFGKSSIGKMLVQFLLIIFRVNRPFDLEFNFNKDTALTFLRICFKASNQLRREFATSLISLLVAVSKDCHLDFLKFQDTSVHNYL